MYLGHGRKPRSGVPFPDVRYLQDSRGNTVSLRFSEVHPRLWRCWELSSNFRKIKRHDRGYSVIRYRRSPGIFWKFTSSPWARAGLRKFQIRKFPRYQRAHRFPRSLRLPPTPVPPAAAARNFRQRDFSNFHCTSQRDFPHANGMRNVRWKRRSDKHRPGEPAPTPSGEWKLFYLPEFVSDWVPIWRVAAVICAWDEYARTASFKSRHLSGIIGVTVNCSGELSS